MRLTQLLQKFSDFVAECEQLYDIRIIYGNTISRYIYVENATVTYTCQNGKKLEVDMSRNINKLHNKIQNERIGTHLFPIKSA